MCALSRKGLRHEYEGFLLLLSVFFLLFCPAPVSIELPTTVDFIPFVRYLAKWDMEKESWRRDCQHT